MRIERINKTGMLWMEAMRARWSLRHASGERRWQLVLHMTSWLRLFRAQTRWLHSIHARESMRRAAQADPRLYERWHRPYISTHFNADARRRIVSAHYTFVMRRFPAWLAERVVLGGGARLASFRLDDTGDVHLHLRKPSRGDAGELGLLLLTEDKDLLATCILTFDRPDSITIGALLGAGAHTPFEATRDFMQASHGLHPRELLLALVRELAALHGVQRIRAVHSSTCAGSSSNELAVEDSDAFWLGQGAGPADSGCHALPLVLEPVPCSAGPRSRAEKRLRSEAFRQQACEIFVAALCQTSAPRPGRIATPVARDAAATAGSGRSASSQKASADQANLLVAGA
ncbi:DUF535 family protein [Rhodanobacter ginsengiterrae]|uniref:DUF535 family protein n=1 Tax=Rhodanobacter ginsengiterrae TaxID=2008451 RepID=UPI003CEA046B